MKLTEKEIQEAAKKHLEKNIGSCMGKQEESLVYDSFIEGAKMIQEKDNWIEIKSKKDLPKERLYCWFFDKKDGIIAGEFLNNSEEQVNFILANTTHYMIINNPKPPTS